jgi:hypothetical protein
MRSRLVIVDKVNAHQLFEMAFIEDNYMVEALATD